MPNIGRKDEIFWIPNYLLIFISSLTLSLRKKSMQYISKICCITYKNLLFVILISFKTRHTTNHSDNHLKKPVAYDER